MADYDAALGLDPKQAQSLYGRGLVKHKKGDLVGAAADIGAAKALQPDIEETFRSYGIE